MALIFFGSIGINIFAHFCKQDGISYSYIIPEEHICSPMETVESCCHEEKTCSISDAETGIKESSCCTEEMWNYKISSEFQNHTLISKIKFSSLFTIQPIIKGYTKIIYRTKVCVANYPLPPPLSGVDRLIKNQIFRI